MGGGDLHAAAVVGRASGEGGRGHEARVDDVAARGEDPQAFRYLDKGTMATIGRSAAVAEIGPLKLKGLVGWLAWLFVHLYYIIGFRNRLVVLVEWAWDYFRYDRPIRLIARAKDSG